MLAFFTQTFNGTHRLSSLYIPNIIGSPLLLSVYRFGYGVPGKLAVKKLVLKRILIKILLPGNSLAC